MTKQILIIFHHQSRIEQSVTFLLSCQPLKFNFALIKHCKAVYFLFTSNLPVCFIGSFGKLTLLYCLVKTRSNVIPNSVFVASVFVLDNKSCLFNWLLGLICLIVFKSLRLFSLGLASISDIFISLETVFVLWSYVAVL